MLETPQLLGLVGRSRAGKDETALHLVNKYGFFRIGFADKIKDILSRAYRVPLEYFYLDEFRYVPHPNLTGEFMGSYGLDLTRWYESILDELKPVSVNAPADIASQEIFVNLLKGRAYSPVEAAQLIGTEGFRRHVNDNVWVDYAIRTAKDCLDAGLSVVIPDVRFPNDFDRVRAEGGDLWALKRQEVRQSDHTSESHVDGLSAKSDLIISNNSTISKLHQLIDAHIISSQFQQEPVAP